MNACGIMVLVPTTKKRLKALFFPSPEGGTDGDEIVFGGLLPGSGHTRAIPCGVRRIHRNPLVFTPVEGQLVH